MEPDDTGRAPAVVVYRATILDGPVLSWFVNLGAAQNGREVISASRNGVMIHGDVYLHTIRRDWLTTAEEAHAALCLGQDVGHLATHVHRKVIIGGRPYLTVEPVDDGRTVAL
jgi:hypothetical protein